MSIINNSINNTLQTPFNLAAVSVTTTGTQLNYLSASTGTTGSGLVVFATAPTLSSLTVTGNATANNFAAGTSPVVLIGGTSTLTNTSTQIIIFSGSGGTIILPDATTLVIGWQYYFHNNCSGNVTIETNGGATLVVMLPGSYIDLTCLTVAVAAGTWAYSWAMPQSAAFGTAGLTVTGQITATTTLTGGNLELTGNTISSTNTNGNLSLQANGTGFSLINSTSALGAGVYIGPQTTDIYSQNGKLCISQTSVSATMLMYCWGGTGASKSSTIILNRSRSAIVGTQGAVIAGDSLGEIIGGGDNGTAFNYAAQIEFICDTTPGSYVPGRIVFLTSNTSSTGNIALTINSAQVATFANPIVTGGVNDANGSAVIQFANSGSPAVNYVNLANNIAGNPPVLQTLGSDSNISLEILCKGTGQLVVATNNTAPIVFESGTSNQHFTYFAFANTSASRTVTFQDANGTLCQDNSGSGSITTAPPVSASSSVAVGTAYQNTLGYDVVITVYVSITAATAASILLGVGPTSTPSQQTIVSSLTTAAVLIVPVTIYLPNNYYALLSTSGTITQTISGQQAMPV